MSAIILCNCNLKDNIMAFSAFMKGVCFCECENVLYGDEGLKLHTWWSERFIRLVFLLTLQTITFHEYCINVGYELVISFFVP